MEQPLTDEERMIRIENKLRLLDEKKRKLHQAVQRSAPPCSITSDKISAPEAQYCTRVSTSLALDSTTEDKLTPFPFSKLPPELKYRVCAIAISQNCTDRGKVHTLNGFNGPPIQVLKSVHGRPDRSPALLRVSHELRQICIPLYYKRTRFVIKTAPRMDQYCPFSKWLANIGRGNALLVHHIVISFHEADHVYVELSIRPQAGAFPRGSVTLEWPQTRKGKTCTAVMTFKRALGSKYPQASINEHGGKPFTVETSNVVKVVNGLFEIGKQAAGGISKGKAVSKGFTMGDALWGGHSRGTVR